MLVQENVLLAPFTTFQIGGLARFFVEAKSTGEIEDTVRFAQSRSLPLFVLGGGSNLVVADSGWPGLVLKIAIRGIDRTADQDGKAIFNVGAGEMWDDFVAHAVAQNCAGIECLSGIPGSVGGTPVQNVGAYGQEVSNTIESVSVFDRRDGQVHELCAEACGFAYRSSIFNTMEHGRFIILGVTYALSSDGSPHLEYADLERYFEGRPMPGLKETRAAVREIRARKGMLIIEDDPDCHSAGSFFKNPVLSEEEHENLNKRAAANGLAIPSYPALHRNRKISAAWLVEHSGFTRGYSLGRAGISSKHALAIVNRGGASAAEIVALKNQIQQRVAEIWGVRLDSEPVFVGI